MYDNPPQPLYFEPTIEAGTTFGGPNEIAIPANSVVTFCQITNLSETTDLQIRLNGNSAATGTLHHGIAQTFNQGDILISAIDFANTPSGGPNVQIQVILGYRAA